MPYTSIRSPRPGLPGWPGHTYTHIHIHTCSYHSLYRRSKRTRMQQQQVYQNAAKIFSIINTTGHQATNLATGWPGVTTTTVTTRGPTDRSPTARLRLQVQAWPAPTCAPAISPPSGRPAPIYYKKMYHKKVICKMQKHHADGIPDDTTTTYIAMPCLSTKRSTISHIYTKDSKI